MTLVTAIGAALSATAPAAGHATSRTAPEQIESVATQIGLFRDGHGYGPFPFETGESGWPGPGSLNFGQTGDRYLQLDAASHCSFVGQMGCRSYDYRTTSAVVARPGAAGGIDWFVQYVPLQFYVTGEALRFSFGNSGDIPLAMTSQGRRVPAVFRPSTGQWFIATQYEFGSPDGVIVLSFGSPGDFPVVGDWDGDGNQTPGVFRAGVFYQLDTLRSGGADREVRFGSPGDVPLAGDWNGDGIATPGVYRAGRWFLTNDVDAASVAHVFDIGTASYQPTSNP